MKNNIGQRDLLKIVPNREENEKMKLSISNIAWDKEHDEEMYEYLSKNGFDGIEIAPTRIFEQVPYEKIEKAREFAKNLKQKYDLSISSIQSIWYGKNARLFGSEEQRESLTQYTKKAINFANVIGCRNLVFGCPKNRSLKTKEDIKVGIQFFKEIGEYAKKKNTVFAIEPNPTIYNTNFINTTKEAFDIVEKIDHDAIKVNVDLGTMIENGENIDVLEEHYHEINHIHISEPNLEKIQKRTIHKELASNLKQKNYQNYVSIEMKRQENIEEVKKVMEYVKDVFVGGI